MPSASTLPDALTPEYTSDINEPITLYEGEGILSAADGYQHRGPCLIRYSWRPSVGPEVIFSALVMDLNAEYTLEVPALGLKAPVMGRRSRSGTNGAPSFTGMLNGYVRMGQETGLTSVLFHIANFPFVFGSGVKRGALQMRARMHLENSPWIINIDPVPDNHPVDQPDLPSRISEAQGYAITHVGSLARSDGNAFDATAADEILRDVSRTLSLARAAFSTPFLRSGYNAAGSKVWQCWSAFRSDAWTAHENWFSKRHPQILQSVFEGWRRLATSPDVDVINAAQHLYIDAHASSLAIESKLVLMQAALEGIAEGWPYPPLPGAAPLPKFDSAAAARVARIAVSLGLSISVPASLSALAALPKPDTNSYALDKMAWVRNSIAHLGNFPRLAPHPMEAKYEASQLAAWHLELALLRLLDAKGAYLNRLKARSHGDIDLLPWLPPSK